LYSSGLRVSELVGLLVSQTYLDVGFVKVTGKEIKNASFRWKFCHQANKNISGKLSDIILLLRMVTRIIYFLTAEGKNYESDDFYIIKDLE